MWKQAVAGLAIVILAGYLAFQYWPAEQQLCRVCLRPTHRVTSYYVTLESGETVELCCPRCGLRFQAEGGRVVEARVTDYSSGQLLDAEEATFVEGSSVHVCCGDPAMVRDQAGTEYERTWDRCLPSVIAFRSVLDAQAFQREHGGAIIQLDQLLTDLARIP